MMYKLNFFRVLLINEGFLNLKKCTLYNYVYNGNAQRNQYGNILI